MTDPGTPFHPPITRHLCISGRMQGVDCWRMAQKAQALGSAAEPTGFEPRETL